MSKSDYIKPLPVLTDRERELKRKEIESKFNAPNVFTIREMLVEHVCINNKWVYVHWFNNGVFEITNEPSLINYKRITASEYAAPGNIPFAPILWNEFTWGDDDRRYANEDLYNDNLDSLGNKEMI